ncbi:MAG: glycerate kinase family protein [Brevinema sp.]
MKKIIIALDSFKGSLSSLEAGRALAEGILQADPSLKTIVYSVADGGEGTLECLQENCRGRIVTVSVQDPLGRPINAIYTILRDGTAVIEMAKASGLTLVEPENRNPLLTSTYGTGQLIAHALDQGVNSIILAIGGSATNDVGIGMLSALGIRFLDKEQNLLSPLSQNLGKIDIIDTAHIHPKLKSCHFIVACDVDNPLYGKNGASYIYGPQKGADSQRVEQLDGYVQHFAFIVERELGIDIAHFSGAGAAGGIGAGLSAFTNTSFRSGIEIILDQIEIDKELKEADLVFVGEGRLDAQTAMGKAPSGIGKRAKKYNVPVVAIGGSLEGDPISLHDAHISAYFTIIGRPMSLEEAMDHEETASGLRRQGRELIRLLNTFI